MVWMLLRTRSCSTKTKRVAALCLERRTTEKIFYLARVGMRSTSYDDYWEFVSLRIRSEYLSEFGPLVDLS